MRPLFDDLSFPPFVHCPELDVVAVGKVPDEELLDGAVGEVGVGSLFPCFGLLHIRLQRRDLRDLFLCSWRAG